MSRSSRCTALLAAGVMVLTACTRPENAVPDTAAPSSADAAVTTSTAASTTSTPADMGVASTTSTDATTTSTSAAPASTAPSTAATSTTRPSPTTIATPTSEADLTLYFDGVLPYRFGERDVDVVPALAAVLGDPVTDVAVEYPDADAGRFYDVDGETAFVAPFGRTVCFTDGLCVQFGAGAPETLIFTGWQIGESGAGSALATEDGLTIGSTLADHTDVITFDPAVSCYSVAYAAAAGIDVTLLSEDGAFAAPNAAGDGLDIFDPDPTLVTVQAMSAGELPEFVVADC